MNKLLKKIICCALLVGLVATGAAAANINTVNADAAEVNIEESAASGITIHYKDDAGTAPNIYYWNSLPDNLEVDYPGHVMSADSSQG